MTFTILSHTGDMRLKVMGAGRRELFANALAALAAILKPDNIDVAPNIKRVVQIKSLDLTTLLIDFLNETLTTAHIYKEIYPRLTIQKFTDTTLRAILHGFSVPYFQKNIKAITYHEAAVKKKSKRVWETLLVLDI